MEGEICHRSLSDLQELFDLISPIRQMHRSKMMAGKREGILIWGDGRPFPLPLSVPAFLHGCRVIRH